MSLPKPILDNRTFAQLVNEGTAQISRLSPSWTNYNASDPGITLLELFAWLSEQNLYRTDRISDEMTRAFLRLVDVVPEPARAASTVVLLATSGTESVALPDRIQLAGPSGAAVFETCTSVTVSPASLVQILAGSDPVAGGSFFPFGTVPTPGAVLYLGFDAPLGDPGTPVSVYVWTCSPLQDARTRAVLVREQTCVDWRINDEARTVWEYLSSSGSWQTLPEIDDETRALTLTGFVRFAVPADHVPGGPGTSWFIRSRLVCGAYTCATRLDGIALNAVRAENAVSIAAPEVLGTSAGHASERYATAAFPVVPGSTHLRLTIGGSPDDEDWNEVLQWDLTGPHDRSYLLEPDAGGITAGNGLRGAVLPAGAQLALTYRVGGGPAGNVAAASLTTVAAGPWNDTRVPGGATGAAALTVTQPLAASGGAAAETLPAAEARAIAALAIPTRAITLNDIVALALSVPGVAVARAAAVPQMHPAVPCFTAAANVTVIVVPDCPGPAPLPSSGFLRTVARYLQPRRPITTELHVVAPTYVTIVVAASLQTVANADASVLSALAQTTLDAFFNPLHGGPDESGWPIGRAVYRTEVMAILATLPGVLAVTDLTLQAGEATPVCGNVDICAVDLICSGRHRIATAATSTAAFTRSTQRECN